MKLIGTFERDGYQRVEGVGESYEAARDALDTAVPEGVQLLNIRAERD